MKEFIFLDGKFLEKNHAKISVQSNSLHYGTAVFEGIRCFKTSNGTAIFRMREHLKRLRKSAEFMHLKLNYSEKRLAGIIKKLVKKNHLSNAYIRPIIFFEGTHLPLNRTDFHVGIAIIASKEKNFFEGRKGISLAVSKFRRKSLNRDLFESKVSGNYPLSFLSKIEANEKGFDDALLLNEKGNVAEASAENIFYVKHGILFTPKINGLLEGITRNSVMEIARGMGLTAVEKTISLKELLSAEEVFLTGTAAGIVPVKKINNKKFKINNKKLDSRNNPITKKLIHEFDSIVSGKNQKYGKWLEFVE